MNAPFTKPPYDQAVKPARSETRDRSRPLGITRRRVILGGVGMATLAGSGTGAYAVGIEAAHRLIITTYRPKPPGWPPNRKLTLTVIADIHAGGPNMGLARVREVVDVANDLRSDIVLVLGDYFATHRFVTEVVPHPVWAGELARLKARLGIWSIYGNHDWWYDIDGVRRALAAVNIPVLENTSVLLGEAGERFWLGGLGDQIAFRVGHRRFIGVDDLPATLAAARGPEPMILMVHEPDIFPQVPDRVALTLAGHTHGGQIRIPLIWPTYVPSEYGARFAYGHIIEEGRHMIVSGGLGTSIVPARLGVPPEILRIELGT